MWIMNARELNGTFPQSKFSHNPDFEPHHKYIYIYSEDVMRVVMVMMRYVVVISVVVFVVILRLLKVRLDICVR